MVKEKNKRRKICKICGEEFMGRFNQKYCSDKCAYVAKFRNNHGRNPESDWATFYRDNFRCQYCGKTPLNDNIRLTIDHVFPKSKGGGNEPYNLITACEECNSYKGEMLWDKEKILEIWYQNKKKRANLPDNLNFEDLKKEFEKNYPNYDFPFD